MSTNLRVALSERILQECIKACNHHEPWVVMVVDNISVNVLAAAFKTHDLLNHGITVVENLHLPRQPLRKLPAIYFLTPSATAIDLFLADWLEGRMYKEAHLCFTSKLQDDHMTRLKAAGPAVLSHIKSLREIFTDFIPIGSSAYVLRPSPAPFACPMELTTLFSMPPPEPLFSDSLTDFALQLSTVCVSLRESPIVRHQNSPIATAFAQMFTTLLGNVYTRGPPPHGTSMQWHTHRATLIVVDRSIDAVAPLLHSFRYMALLADLIGLDGALSDRITLPSSAKAPAASPEKKGSLAALGPSDAPRAAERILLEESDSLWLRFRYCHIADVSTGIDQSLRQFQQSDPVAAARLSGSLQSATTTDLANLVRSAPQFHQTVSRLSTHINLCGHLSSRHRALGLIELAKVEQQLATGDDGTGKRVEPKALGSQVIELLGSHPAFSADQMNRLRFVALVMASAPFWSPDSPLKPAFLESLYSAAGISEALGNNIRLRLSAFGVSNKAEGPRKAGAAGIMKFFTGRKRSAPKQARGRETTYDSDRYIPALCSVIDGVASGNLQESDFPHVCKDDIASVFPMESLRVKFQTGGPPGGPRRGSGVAGRQRLILFVLGGITANEIAVCDQWAAETGIVRACPFINFFLCVSRVCLRVAYDSGFVMWWYLDVITCRLHVKSHREPDPVPLAVMPSLVYNIFQNNAREHRSRNRKLRSSHRIEHETVYD